MHALLGAEYILSVLLRSCGPYYCMPCALLRADRVDFVDWCMRCALLRAVPRPSTAPGLGVDKWSPEGLYDKSESCIPNTDEIRKLV